MGRESWTLRWQPVGSRRAAFLMGDEKTGGHWALGTRQLSLEKLGVLVWGAGRREAGTGKMMGDEISEDGRSTTRTTTRNEVSKSDLLWPPWREGQKTDRKVLDLSEPRLSGCAPDIPHLVLVLSSYCVSANHSTKYK